MKKNLSIFVLIGLAVAVSSCGSSDSAPTTTDGILLKQSALPLTSTTTTALPSASASTSVPSTTTTVPVKLAAVVTDPGTFRPTYLGTGDALGTPRVSLTSEANLATNPSRTVSSALQTDATNNLSVTKAEWIDASPMKLRWTVRVGTRSVPCDNCAFLASHVKKTLAAVLASNSGADVSSVYGLQATRHGVGEFIGSGWAFELIVAAPNASDQRQNGNEIRDWLINCTGTTASTCRNTKLGVAEIHWRNTYWSVADCTLALINGGPKRLHDDHVAQYVAANVELKALLKHHAAMDRVYVALPLYRPIFTTTGTLRSLNGYSSTGCAS